MPKKGGKGADKKDAKKEGPDITLQVRKVKQIIAQVMAGQQTHGRPESALDQSIGEGGGHGLDKLFLSMITNALEESTGKLVFQKDPHKPGEDGIKMLMQVIAEACPAYFPLKSMAFWRTVVNDGGLLSICEHLLCKKKNEQLQYNGFQNLELFDCKISPVGCRSLAEKLAMDVPLQSLSLDFNAIGDEGVQALAQGLKHNTHLKVLSLQYCRIGPSGGTVLGDEIVRSSGVTRLVLKGNRVMAEGLTVISRNIGKSNTLVALDLSDNSISGVMSAINALCEALRTSASIQEVDLEHNVIENQAATVIMETLSMCSHIKIFRFCGQQVSKDVYKEAYRDGKGKKGKGKGKKKKK